MNIKKLFKNVGLKKYVLLALTLGTFASFAEIERPRAIGKQVESVSQSDVKAVDAVLSNMKERLIFMHEVSKWKWKNTEPIEKHNHDFKQLNAFHHACKKMGLDETAAMSVINGQIDAGKVIQEEDFHDWIIEERHVGTSESIDEQLITTQLDQLNEDLAEKLSHLLPIMKKSDMSTLIEARARAILKDERISQDAKKTALTPLLSLYNKVSNQ